MKNTLVALGLSVGVLAPIAAEAFTTARGTRVNPIDAQVFEVIPKSSGTVADFWCGASEYARRTKAAGWSDLIYVVQGRSTSVTTGKKSAVQFSLSASKAGPAPQGWLRLGIKAGDRMSVQQANTYCHQLEVELR